MAQILSGKAVSQSIRDSIRLSVEEMVSRGFRAPKLAVIRVGEDPASAIYVRNKHNACREVGIESIDMIFPENSDEKTVADAIDALANDDGIDGILLQLPVPKHLDGEKLLSRIPIEKDVDGFTEYSSGRLFLGKPGLRPCTPAGIMEILDFYHIPIAGKKCVVVGRSNIVGKPMAHLLLGANGTVTVAHSKSENLPAVTREADILVLAVGKSGFCTTDMVKDGAVVIDVGINRTNEGKVVGDADPDIYDKLSAYTPVPGGVGPMTVTMLLKNTLDAAKARIF